MYLVYQKYLFNIWLDSYLKRRLRSLDIHIRQRYGIRSFRLDLQ